MTLQALLITLVVAMPLTGGAYRHQETGLSLWLPDDWNVDLDAAAVAAFPPSGDPRFELAVLPGAADLAAASGRALRQLQARFRQFEEDEPRRDLALNGMRGYAWAGHGVHGGAGKQVRLLVFKAPRAWVMVWWAADRRRAARFEETWDRIAQGLEPDR
jgi:hypothetical protein